MSQDITYYQNKIKSRLSYVQFEELKSLINTHCLVENSDITIDDLEIYKKLTDNLWETCFSLLKSIGTGGKLSDHEFYTIKAKLTRTECISIIGLEEKENESKNKSHKKIRSRLDLEESSSTTTKSLPIYPGPGFLTRQKDLNLNNRLFNPRDQEYGEKMLHFLKNYVIEDNNNKVVDDDKIMNGFKKMCDENNLLNQIIKSN
jgi:hypothetical protein